MEERVCGGGAGGGPLDWLEGIIPGKCPLLSLEIGWLWAGQSPWGL